MEEPKVLSLNDLMGLVDARINIATSLDEAVKKVKELQALLDRYDKEFLPEALMSIGVEKLDLKNGYTVSYGKSYYASLPSEKEQPEKRSEAIQWLINNNHGGIIKNQIAVAIGTDDLSKVNEEVVLRFLKEQEIEFDQKQTVHGNTLKAFVKEELEAGREIPLELFQAVVVNEATIKEPKEGSKGK